MKIINSWAIFVFMSVFLLSACNDKDATLTNMPSETNLPETNLEMPPMNSANVMCTPNIKKYDASEADLLKDTSAKESSVSPTVSSVDEKEVQDMKLKGPQLLFGFSNPDGSKLIVLPKINTDNRLFSYFEYAVGWGGQVTNIEYSQYQMQNLEKDSGRQTSDNFDNEAGCVYNVTNPLGLLKDTYMLLTKTEYAKMNILAERESSVSTASTCKLLRTIEGLANRNVKNVFDLAEYENGMIVSIVEFMPNENDLLTWLVIQDGTSLLHCDFPATLDGDMYSAWSLGDMGNLTQTSCYVLCTIQKQSDIIVYLGWYDEEGETIHEVRFPADKSPFSTIVAGRYM